MKILEVLAKRARIINEGGNVVIGKVEANRIDASQRAAVIPVLEQALAAISNAFAKFNKKTPLWNPELLANKQFLSGSAFHFFNRAEINDLDFAKVKPTVGDIDTQVDKDQKEAIGVWLNKLKPGIKLGPAVYVGAKLSGEQYITLWTIPKITMQNAQGKEVPTNIQIDLELKQFQKGAPSPWSKFSASSAWEDLQSGIKGVFHKYLIQSMASLTKQDFLLRKLVGRGKARAEQDVPFTDNMFSFAVSSKEGGGLRAKYEPVLDNKNKPLIKDGLPVLRARPTTDYEQDLPKMFVTLFGGRLNDKQSAALEPKFWSFSGMLEIINQFLNKAEKQKVLEAFVDKTFGEAAQGLYVNDPERDANEKMVAINYMLKALKMPEPSNLKQLVKNYKAAYKVSSNESITEDETGAPDYKRQGIKHIYNPGSSTEMRDADFIAMCEEIAENGGTLNDIPINLKVDGAGIRFGRDQKGAPFFMTSRVTKPLYANNIGDFERFGQSRGQPPEQLARTRNYDKALETVVNSNFIKTLPKDTIVQAEMLFNDMAQKTANGYTFVNISYDPKKLGRVMTLVPFAFKQYSTGETLPNSEKIKDKLLSQSDKSIKFVDNQLKQNNINVSTIIQPVVGMDPKLRAALQSRSRDNPQKQAAQTILVRARKALSDAIINNPRIKGKDQLGKNIEGLVINMPGGILAKVTSNLMQGKMAAKKTAEPQYDKAARTAVVAIGNFAGHRGHEQLIGFAIGKAKELNGTPFVFVGHKVGKDDPIDIHTKLETLRKLFPGVSISEVQNQIDPTTGAETVGNIFKKIEYELVKKPPYYNNIIITVGKDQAGVAKIAQTMQARFSKFPPLSHVKVSVYVTPRGADEGGTGISTTDLRNVLKNPNLTPEDKLAEWSKAYNVQKLGVPWIKHLMDVARKNMHISNIDEKIREIEGDSISPVGGARAYTEAKRSRVRPASEKLLQRLRDLENKKKARQQPPVAPQPEPKDKVS